MRMRLGCTATVLVTATISGCGTTPLRSPAVPRLLTSTEMDQISAGSAAAMSNADAIALGPTPGTMAFTTTLSSSGYPVLAQPFASLLSLNYAAARSVASAQSASFARADGSSHIAVDGRGGGASIVAMSAAMAGGSETSRAQIDIQFYGLSIGQVDLTFGSAIATACCAPSFAVQTNVDRGAGGYWRQLEASPISNVPGQVRSRIDISVVSSALPILDAGQVLALFGVVGGVNGAR